MSRQPLFIRPSRVGRPNVTLLFMCLVAAAFSACTVDRTGLAHRDGGRLIDREPDGSVACDCPDDGNPCTTEACSSDGECAHLFNEEPCGPERECGPFGYCKPASEDVCDEAGVTTRVCARHECRQGTCTLLPYAAETSSCLRDTDGIACDREEECTVCQCSAFFCQRTCWRSVWRCESAACVFGDEEIVNEACEL